MTSRRRAIVLFVSALTVVLVGGALAARNFPGGFDWQYTVISALASRKHNPDGSRWLAGALAVSMALLLPVAGSLRDRRSPRDVERNAVLILQCGLGAALLLGLERLLIFHLSDIVHKVHEALAVLAFLCVYVGLITLHVLRLRFHGASKWPIVSIVAPLVAAAIGQLLLYLQQRDIGWVGVRWREAGIPIWMSLAFWQWVAVAALWVALGRLVFARDRGGGGSTLRS